MGNGEWGMGKQVERRDTPFDWEVQESPTFRLLKIRETNSS
jgi:hypothetical protein